ncbi:MAG: hemolysin family protein [Candidatus Omnitrophica bacterium]|nr:hemolysin family protein [Candidatus Omnitrophota bacterium]
MLAISIFLLVFATISFFLSAAETSIIALSKIRLKHMVAKGVRRANHVQNLVTRLDKFIATILVGNNFINIAMSSILTGILVRKLGYNWGVVISALVSALFIVVLCEITPKILATKHPEKVALFTAPIMEVLVTFFNPVTRIFTSVSNFLLRVFGVGPSKRSPLITEEELRLMIEVGKEEGVLSDEERKMLHRIFEFGDTRLSEVMVPRDKMVAVNINTSPEELLNTFLEEGHARLPVYKDSTDTVIGIIYAHDLLYILKEKGLFLLQDLLHPAYYAPASMRVNELLKKFQADKIQMAIVVDEHKMALGLVTLEDLFEEIVGEIEEEHVTHSSPKK